MTSDIDIGGVKPLVTRTEILCGRPGNTRISAGKPTYKSQEEQYQEIQELRRNLGELREEHSGLKTRNRRLEEDLIRRDRQIEQLMDPSKNDEARRKLTDKGASLVSSLKLRVSRLEATLKDKEAELAKLQASAKATALNEMKIEAETYYQEVVRLRNQLNIAQHQQQQHQQQHHYQKPPQQFSSPQHSQQYSHSLPQPPQLQPPVPQDPKGATIGHWSNMRSGRESRDGVRGRRDGGDGQESPSTSLRHALVQLEEENTRLGNQLSTLTAENSKLTADMERVLGLSEDIKSNFEGMSRAELIREVERGHEEMSRLESQHTQLTEALTRRNDIAGESSALLQARVSELQGREVEWDRERSSLRELINTLKEDRMFYKETAQKKDSELDSLRAEVQALQQEVIALHDSQRRRNEFATPPLSQRTARGSTRPSLSSASRSGSSSDTNASNRRPRPSSARPPSSGTRPLRSHKSSSEPREIPHPSNARRTPTQQSPKRAPISRSSSSKPPSTPSSPSKASVSNMMNSGSNARPGSSSNKRASTSSVTPKASPYGSPKHSSVGRATSTSLSSKTPTPTSSPRKTAGSVSPQRRVSSSTSPQHKTTSSSSSVGRIPTSRSSSRTSTPSSSAKSSPNKTNTPDRSPSKVPLPRSATSSVGSPIKNGKKREESASPTRTPKSSKQGSLRDSSAFVAVGSRRHVAASSVIKSSKLRVTEGASPSYSLQPDKQGHCTYQTPLHAIPSQQLARTRNSQGGWKKEEDERVLAEILFHRETDSSGEASDFPYLARQRTITLTSQEDTGSGQEEAETPAEQPASLQRQNTVTLSSKTDDEESVVNKETSQESVAGEEELVINRESSQELVAGEEESVVSKESSLELVAGGGEEEEEEEETQVGSKKEDECKSEVLKSSSEEDASTLHDDEIIENLEILQSLLSSHLSRQREVNELLSQEPLLVGEGQPQGIRDPQESSREGETKAREAPDGEESGKASSKRSQNMVRQGTFNVNGQETVATIHATLDAHLTRVNKVHHFNTK